MTATRFGIGFDSHRFARGRRLVLGGVEIEDAERGLAGHSDADVLAHAVTDALLGAAGLGDIGDHFPDSDERYRDADSIELLEHAVMLLARDGLRPANLDATVICESPRLSPHREAMRSRLAGATGLEYGSANVKFGTNEGMGFLGRGEGIAALAVAAVVPAGDAGAAAG